ncbi:hypothetical protein Sp245p_16295 (plasmid) [Azospirillum baldaniorum]|uniref:Uncharacterized protein n=1 Tax=Azospirillum baldaniorum TaxID=1064539 RepID=A0A9P1NNU6_9PROT|nr:hypothetical protein Sp245p_16295 [Azospirillum baldaniorum]CCC99689.1 protein of unknown function [Azospirillum baldaniorum]
MAFSAPFISSQVNFDVPCFQPQAVTHSPFSRSVIVDHVTPSDRPSIKNVSTPVPPVRKFEPVPPSSTSLPPPPLIASLPPRELMKSANSVPAIASFSSVPICMFCKPLTGPT